MHPEKRTASVVHPYIPPQKPSLSYLWKRLFIRIAFIGCVVFMIGYLNLILKNVASAASLPTMAFGSPDRPSQSALPDNPQAIKGKSKTTPTPAIQLLDPFTATTAIESTPDQMSSTPDPDGGHTPTPVVATPTTGGYDSSPIPTIRLPTVTPTLLATKYLTPTETITSTWVTAEPTIIVSVTATLQPIEIKGDYISDQLVVKFANGVSKDEILEILSAWQVNILEEISELGFWILNVDPEQLPYLLAFLQSSPRVASVEPNYVAHAFAQPDDPEINEQSYLRNIQAEQAWDVTTGSRDVIIAIIDTGIDVQHKELTEKIWVNPGEIGKDSYGNDRRSNRVDDDRDGYIDDWQGWNAITNDGLVADSNGHGTHVAGIAGASSNNNFGIAGISWDSQLMPIKALDDEGSGSYSQIARSILFAAQHGAQVINISLGGDAPSDLLRAAVDYANNHGSLLVAAAGDAGENQPIYPAAYEPVIAVGATNLKNKIIRSSNYGEMIDLVAPGAKIYSTVPGGKFSSRTGTSAAAAQVSGVAALLFGLNTLDSPARIRQVLLNTATDLGQPGKDHTYGAGLLQAFSALTYDMSDNSIIQIEYPGASIEPQPNLPTATLPPPVPTIIPHAEDPHVQYAPTTDSCAACHRSHTATGSEMRFTWPEEQVCFNCHTSNNPYGATNVQLAFSNPPQNTNTAIYKHDISFVNGVHQAREQAPSAYAGANRHIECEDCHEPHEATRGASSPPMIQRVMNFVSGVDPTWSGAGSPSSYSWLPQANREYQVCFKCHSSYTTLPTYSPDGWNGIALVANGLRKLTNTAATQIQDSRDLAREFNPDNASFHPLAAQGRNQSIPAASFVNGWSQISLVYCSDCHNNPSSASQGLGPHGSPLLHILKGTANYTTIDGRPPTSGEVCFACHSYAVYVTTESTTATNFRKGGDNLHRKHISEDTTCYTCHDTHGSEQLHLINFDASAMTMLGSRNSQTAWYEITTGNGGGGCFVACHGKEHNPLDYNR